MRHRLVLFLALVVLVTGIPTAALAVLGRGPAAAPSPSLAPSAEKAAKDPATGKPTKRPKCRLQPGEQVLATWQGTVGQTVPVGEASSDGYRFTPPEACTIESLRIRVEWDDAINDLDLVVTDPEGTEHTSGGTTQIDGAVEEVDLQPALAGEHLVAVNGYLNTEQAYTGTVFATVAAAPTTPPPNTDVDLDGKPNDGDNCPTVSNRSQTDTDADRAGDACDTPVPPLAAEATSTIFTADGTSGLTVQVPPIGPGADYQGTGYSATGELEHRYLLTLSSVYPDYRSLDLRLDWELEGKDYFVLEVTKPDGATVTGLFVNTNYQEVAIADPAPGEYTVVVRESRTTGGSFTAVGQVTRATKPPTPPLPPIASDPTRPRVVVADLDSGINPYHSFYYAGSAIYPDRQPSSVTAEVLAALGVKPENVVTLTRTGNLAADLAADKPFWDRVKRGELYHFRGTNIIATGLSSVDDPLPVLKPDPGKSPHGVGTSGSVLAANPDAVLLFIEAGTALGSDESHKFAFQHPAVDIVTTSYGFSVPETGFPLPEVSAFGFTHEGVVQRGKLHFSSGGNGPGLTPFRAGAGPWWSIGVSGIEEGSSEGRTTLSGNFPDFVSDFTQDVPYCMDCEAGFESVGGTSFSTPRAAGVASKVLLDARTMVGHAGGITAVDGVPTMAAGRGKAITNWQLRRALEVGAWTPDVAAYDPVAGALDLGAVPVNPVAPWLQVGWGDLSADPARGVVSAALTELGLASTPRTKPDGTCEFQTGVVTARQVWWSDLMSNSPFPILGETPPPRGDTDPFVYC